MNSDWTRNSVFLAALLADSINLECVTGGCVVVFVADLLLQFADFLRKKFHRTAALRAHHVVMAAPVVLMLVAGDAVVKGHFAGQPALGQQFQCSIHRRKANSSIFLLHDAVEFVGRQVVTGFEKSAQNRIALRGLLQAHALQMLVEDLLRLANHFARDGGLVIDAFLQHGRNRMRV